MDTLGKSNMRSFSQNCASSALEMMSESSPSPMELDEELVGDKDVEEVESVGSDLSEMSLVEDGEEDELGQEMDWEEDGVSLVEVLFAQLSIQYLDESRMEVD